MTSWRDAGICIFNSNTSRDILRHRGQMLVHVNVQPGAEYEVERESKHSPGFVRHGCAAAVRLARARGNDPFAAQC